MGEEHNEEGKKEQEKKDDKKQEAAAEIVLKVDMHCEACARKVAKALKGFQGVEEVSADCRGSRVVVKGKAADPIKVLERLQKKSGKTVKLLSPLPEPPQQQEEEKKEPPPPEKEEKKDDEPPPPTPPGVVTLVLKVGMHCEACAQVIQKRIRKIQGVESVETDLVNDQVIVKGVIEAAKLVDYVYKRTGKQASIVKEEKKKQEEEEKKEDRAKNGEQNNNKEKEEGEENKTENKRSEYWPSKNYVDYAYAPHFFSDENPNACSLM